MRRQQQEAAKYAYNQYASKPQLYGQASHSVTYSVPPIIVPGSAASQSAPFSITSTLPSSSDIPQYMVTQNQQNPLLAQIPTSSQTSELFPPQQPPQQMNSSVPPPVMSVAAPRSEANIQHLHPPPPPPDQQFTLVSLGFQTSQAQPEYVVTSQTQTEPLFAVSQAPTNSMPPPESAFTANPGMPPPPNGQSGPPPPPSSQAQYYGAPPPPPPQQYVQQNTPFSQQHFPQPTSTDFPQYTPSAPPPPPPPQFQQPPSSPFWLQQA